MKELSVYFCPKCGRYAYYQLEKHAECSRCDQKMLWLNISYIDFIRLGSDKRDKLIADEILQRSSSVKSAPPAKSSTRSSRQKIDRQQKDTSALLDRIDELEKENKKLNDTVEWMHQTIWELLNQRKELETLLAQKSHEAK